MSWPGAAPSAQPLVDYSTDVNRTPQFAARPPPRAEKSIEICRMSWLAAKLAAGHRARQPPPLSVRGLDAFIDSCARSLGRPPVWRGSPEREFTVIPAQSRRGRIVPSWGSAEKPPPRWAAAALGPEGPTSRGRPGVLRPRGVPRGPEPTWPLPGLRYSRRDAIPPALSGVRARANHQTGPVVRVDVRRVVVVARGGAEIGCVRVAPGAPAQGTGGHRVGRHRRRPTATARSPYRRTPTKCRPA